MQKSKEKNARDYEAWKAGTFIPTPRKLQSMKEDGFVFPENVETVAPGGEMMLAKSLTNEQYRPQPRPQLPDDKHFPHAGKSHAQQLHNQQIQLPLHPLPHSYVPPPHQSHMMVQKTQQYNMTQ